MFETSSHQVRLVESEGARVQAAEQARALENEKKLMAYETVTPSEVT